MMFSKSHHKTNTTPTPAGRLCSKLQDYTGTGNIYAYSPNSKQHAVRRIYNGLTNELYNLRWDNNGNLAQQTVYSVNNNTTNYQTMRMLFWDEDDRLNLVAGDGYLSYYSYGHDGNRAIKMTGNAAIDQTGMLLNSTNLENITIYPNEYLTVTQAEYTKYYYAGGNRIASKIGTGGFEKMTRLCTLDQSLSYNANVLFDNVIQQIVSPINQPNDEFPVDVCSGYSVATELLTNPLPDFYISNTALNFMQNNLLQQFRQNLAGGTEAVYFFHSDHLGSASWITNNAGLPVQHLLYLPFGEHFVNERSTTYDERFTFTGKERDAETGYYYHGARFNSSDIGWLGVDPQFDKLPSTTPYNYCLWNPIIFHDPDGEIPWILIPIIKGVAGAAIDAAAQVTISMINGQSFSQAVSKIDYTSVLTAGFTSAFLTPGASTAVKYGGTILIIIDAAVDANFEGDVRSVGGFIGENKPIEEAAVDATCSFLPSKCVDNATSNFNKAINSDLSSSSSAILTKETKNNMRQAQSIVNSNTFQTVSNSTTNYTFGLIGNAVTFDQDNQTNSNVSYSSYPTERVKPVIHTNDATSVRQRPVLNSTN